MLGVSSRSKSDSCLKVNYKSPSVAWVSFLVIERKNFLQDVAHGDIVESLSVTILEILDLEIGYFACLDFPIDDANIAQCPVFLLLPRLSMCFLYPCDTIE